MKNQVAQISPDLLRTESEIIASWTEEYDQPLVSVSCITFNHEKHLEDAIIGFLKQETTFPIEILIHDDASTDGTSKIIDKYREKYPHLIKPMIQTKNQFSKGFIAQSFNVNRARGEFLALCEGDDYWLSSSHLQRAIEVFMAEKDISIYGGASYVLKGTKVKVYTPNPKRFSLSSYVKKTPFVTTCSLVTKTEIWKKILSIPVYGGRYFAGDTRLKLISLTFGDMYVSQNPGVVYRKNSGSSSWSSRNITEEVDVRELLDNLAITREVGILSNYIDSDTLFRRVQSESLLKGLNLAARKGNFAWLCFILLHLKLLSPRFSRPVIYCNPLVKRLRKYK
ncbi:Poly-beta-1,6-N-acetyl-D-glucosamine synthase [Pseudidiomarina piscicola]|uniref:Poly-beta-1,6-N-acetyl-D-glucosamine synthase n=1 Tax=Pseudidiomarina piscicola TaxID=2614830 RepID=A0A6S6WNZ0_9GAMM|nr:glycosyltransferase [Pseudidiomarina piscicola]CAB0151213.1 Poly-beta-1,6-N-acetyl-D-glucosamine synthase [Pseudidiomarina piscicola]VZT40719.1 Poly-beta-1,6-N-acetyl-D-glucosamine synthase [Pseudomonas aeruginosa]